MLRAISVGVLALAALHSQDKSPNAEALLDSGISQFHHGDYADARKTFSKALAMSPADARAIAYFLLTRSALGDCSEAGDELRLQFERNRDPDLKRLSGVAAAHCFLAANDFDRLMPLLVELHEAYPADPDVLYESAKAYNRAWNHEIVELFERAPDSYRVAQLSGEIFESQGKYGEAANAYAKAVEKNPGAPRLHYQLGRMLLARGRTPELLEKARGAFEAELKLNPGDAASHYQLGQISLASAKPAEAAEQFQSAIDAAPKFPEALVALAKLRIDAKEYAPAIELLKSALQAQPASQAAHQTLIAAYEAEGKRKDAERERQQLEKLRKPAGGQFADFVQRLEEKAKP